MRNDDDDDGYGMRNTNSIASMSLENPVHNLFHRKITFALFTMKTTALSTAHRPSPLCHSSNRINCVLMLVFANSISVAAGAAFHFAVASAIAAGVWLFCLFFHLLDFCFSFSSHSLVRHFLLLNFTLQAHHMTLMIIYYSIDNEVVMS